MKSILFIHQSAELYGSDKTLLLLLKYLDKSKFKSVVILPNDGPLKIALENENIKVVLAPVLKLHRKMFTPKNIFQFLKDYRKGIKTITLLHKEYKFDIIYSNTLAVLLGIIFAKKSNIKHLWHVHEILRKPKIINWIFSKFLTLKSNSLIVYNSKVTMDFWTINNAITSKSVLIYNAIETPKLQSSAEEITQLRNSLFNSNPSEIIIALVGRISKWKGQNVLLGAFEKIIKSYSNCKLIFVGSPPPNQDVFLNELKTKIDQLQLNNHVILIPFTEQINRIWQAIDIAIVPSTEPEPFGLVALESMLAKKPVIGSNHGGLTEIIVNNQTGFLVQPNNEIDLANAISVLIDNPDLRLSMGNNGFERAVQHFSVENYLSKFEGVFESM